MSELLGYELDIFINIFFIYPRKSTRFVWYELVEKDVNTKYQLKHKEYSEAEESHFLDNFAGIFSFSAKPKRLVATSSHSCISIIIPVTAHASIKYHHCNQKWASDLSRSTIEICSFVSIPFIHNSPKPHNL